MHPDRGGGDRWAVVAFREQHGIRKELYRERGFNQGLAGPTPAEGIAVIKALQWAIYRIEKGVISPDDFIKVGSDNSAVFTKMLGEGRIWGEYTQIWSRREDLCRTLKDRLVLEVDTTAIAEADRFAQLMPGDPRD